MKLASTFRSFALANFVVTESYSKDHYIQNVVSKAGVLIFDKSVMHK